MADITIKMLNTAVSSFVRRDTELAATVEKMDDEVDELFLKEKNILVDMMGSGEKTDRKTAEQTLEVLMIAKYFERIGDHTVNIAHPILQQAEKLLRCLPAIMHQAQIRASKLQLRQLHLSL